MRASRLGGVERLNRSRRVVPPPGDLALAVVLSVLLVLGSIGESYPDRPADQLPPGHVAPWWAYSIVVVATLVLAYRRRWPVPVLAVSTAAVGAYTMLGYVEGAALIAPMIALYTAVSIGGVRRALLLGAATLAVLMSLDALFNPWGHLLNGPGTVIPFEIAAVLFLGMAVSNRRAYVAEIRDRADRAEARRDEEARRQVDRERLRIARELHDVVAHSMATINVQAAAAAHLLPARPERAAEALGAIRDASRDGLRELRTILNVLRRADEAEPTTPVPGLARLDTLLATARGAGLEATLRLDGPLPTLPAGVDLAAYRIVQESLTNAVRHAPGAAATVALSAPDGALHVEITDTGATHAAARPAAGIDPPGAGTGDRGEAPAGGETPAAGHRRGGQTPARSHSRGGETATGRHSGGGEAPAGGLSGGGHGLAGMRERAGALGGTFEAGPVPGGGFRVTARLPLEGDR